MTLDLPRLPYSYPADDVYDDDPDPIKDYLLTFTEQAAKRSVAWTHPEVQRRFFAVQLKVYTSTGGVVAVGYGTGWRVQPASGANHAKPGNSNHEQFPVQKPAAMPPATPEAGAVAIDTIGTPDDATAWTEMERHLRDCGLINFMPGGGAHSTNSTGVPYRGSWDRPHIQPYEIPYSRNFRTKPWDLKPWPLEPRFDVNVVGLDPFAHPLWGGDNPAEHPAPPPPIEENDDMHGVAVVRLTADRTDQFVRGEDGRLYHNWQLTRTGPWSPWQDLGGEIFSSPTVHALGVNDIVVSALGGDDGPWIYRWNGVEWSREPSHPVGVGWPG